MKKEKINVDELNEVIDTGNKILKLSYIFMLLALIAGIIYLLRTLNIFPIIGTILSVISPFFIGFIIAWLLNPLVNKLTYKGMKRSIATVVVFILFLVLIYLFCLAVIPSLISQLNDIAKMIPDLLKNGEQVVDKVFKSITEATNIDMSSVKVDFLNYVNEFSKEYLQDLPAKIITIVQDLASGIGKFIIGIVIGFYLLFNFNNFNKHLMNLVPRKFKVDTEKIVSELSEIVYKFINGTFIDTLILFVVSIIGFSLIGLNAPVFFAFFCAFTNIIPYIGPYIGGIPAILVGFSQSPVTGLLVLIFIIVAQALESNFLHPIVIGKCRLTSSYYSYIIIDCQRLLLQPLSLTGGTWSDPHETLIFLLHSLGTGLPVSLLHIADQSRKCHIINTFSTLTLVINFHGVTTGTVDQDILNFLRIFTETGYPEKSSYSLAQCIQDRSGKTALCCTGLPAKNCDCSLIDAQFLIRYHQVNIEFHLISKAQTLAGRHQTDY